VVSSNYRYSVSDTGGTTTGASVVTLYLDVPITLARLRRGPTPPFPRA